MLIFFFTIYMSRPIQLPNTAEPFLPGEVGGTYALLDRNLIPNCCATGCKNKVDSIVDYMPFCNQHALRYKMGNDVPIDEIADSTWRAGVAVMFGIPVDAVGSTYVDDPFKNLGSVINPAGRYTVLSDPDSVDGRKYKYIMRPIEPVAVPASVHNLAFPSLFGAPEAGPSRSVGFAEDFDLSLIAANFNLGPSAPASGAVTPKSGTTTPRAGRGFPKSGAISPGLRSRSVSPGALDRALKLMSNRTAASASESANQVANVIVQSVPNVDIEQLTRIATQAATQAAMEASSSELNRIGNYLIGAVEKTAAAAQSSSLAVMEAASAQSSMQRGFFAAEGNVSSGITAEQLGDAINHASQLAAARAAENLIAAFESRVQFDPRQIQQFIDSSTQFAQMAARIGDDNAQVARRVEEMQRVSNENERQKLIALANVTQNQTAVFGRIENLSKNVAMGNRLAQQNLEAVDVQTRTLQAELQSMAANIPTAAQIGQQVGTNIQVPTAAQIAAAIPAAPVPASADAIGIAVANRMAQSQMRPPSAAEIVDRMIRENMRPPSAHDIGISVQQAIARAGGVGGGGGGGGPPGRGPGRGGPPAPGGGAPGGGPPGGGPPAGAAPVAAAPAGGPVPMQGIIFANPNNPNPVVPPGGGAMDLEGGPLTQQFVQEFMSRLADMSEQQRKSYVNFMNTINKQITDIIRKKKPFDEELRQTYYDQLLNQYGFIMGEGYISNVIDVVFAAQARYHEDWRAGGIGFVRSPAIGVNPYLYPINLPPKPVALPSRTPRNAVPGTNGAIVHDPMDVDSGPFIEGAGLYGNIKNPTIPPVRVSFDSKALTDKYICTQKYQGKLRSKKFRSMFEARLFAMSGGFYSDELAKTRQASYQRPQNRLRVIPNITR